MAGESVRLGDDPDSLPWPVDHVSWHNLGVAALTLTFEDADPTFDDIRAVRALEWFGFERLVGGWPTA